MDAEAIKEIINQTRAGSVVETGKGNIVLPDDWCLEDTEQYDENPKRFRGYFTTATISDFLDYFALHAKEGSKVFVNANAMSATAIFDYTHNSKPGWCQNNARFTAEQTDEYNDLKRKTGEWLNQMEIVHFIEDMGEFLRFYDTDGSKLDIKQVVQAFRTVKKSENTEITSDVQDLGQSGSVLSEVKIKSPEEKIPSRMVATLSPYEGFEEYGFEFRVASRISSLDFKLQPIRKHIVREAIKKDFLAMLVGEIDQEKIFSGTFVFKGPGS